MNKRFKNYQDELIEELRNPKEARAYLNAALMDEDPRVFLVALKNVLEAQGDTMSSLARKTALNRENLFRALSTKGNPRLSNIKSILNALGWQLSVQPYKK